MNSDSPQDIYAKCLPNNRGYPLWFPEPSNTLPSSYIQDGLQIGDVGHVSRRGRFNVLLNICFDSNHALHRRLRRSFSFDPIALDIDHEVDVISNADPPGCIIISPGITHSRTSQRDGHYEFTPSPNAGAILVLPDGATSHDLPANERFRRAAMKHAFEWYGIARELYGESINNDSLYLLTGFYKARSWSLASFHDATGAELRSITVVPREGEGTTTRREWICTFPVHYRDGPGHNGNVNQTVFVSGFKIAVRDGLLGWMFQKPEVQPVPGDGSGNGFDNQSSSQQPRTENRGADVKDVPALSQPFHPSDAINRYLLNKDPGALVAIAHDSEWIMLIETGKLTPEELAQGDRLEECLSEHYSLVSQPEHGAVYLQDKSKDVGNSVLIDAHRTLSEADMQQVLSEPVNFQVITRFRAEDVVAGFRRMPVGFYVIVQFDGTKRRTANKPIHLHDTVVEWDDIIRLPSEHSARVQLSVCASFEFSPMLGNGEILRTVEICVGDLADNTRGEHCISCANDEVLKISTAITFSPTQGAPQSPCSSLLITTERRRSHKSGATSDNNDDFDWDVSSDLAQLTDQGHDALLRYRDDTTKSSVTAAVGYFEKALSRCPKDDERYAAALCNLASAQFIQCQIDRSVDLSTTISYYRQVLELRPVGHPDRPGTLLLLADVLLYHCGKLGFEEFPGEIVALASEVQDNCSEDSHERRAADLALQTRALYKVISSGSLAGIDKSILGLRQAVQDIPKDYFDRHQRLTSLSLALWIRYEVCGDLSTLDESIAIHAEAMQFTHCGPDSLTHSQLLKERENATLPSSSWKDALVTAAGFAVPRFTVYRIICERLETMGHITEASECLRQMVDEFKLGEMKPDTGKQDKQAQWELKFRGRCVEKLDKLGDTARDSNKHDEAIGYYSNALSLAQTNLSTLLKHSDELSKLESPSYRGDEGKHAEPEDVLSWTNKDPRESQLFNTLGVLYRFATVVNNNEQSITTLWRVVRANREDRVAKLEWAFGGGLGRAVISKNAVPMSDLVRPDPRYPGARIFNAPDGLQYRWRPSSNSPDVVLEDPNGIVVALFRPTRPTRYEIGEVYGELHFFRNAGAGTVMHPPMMDTVTVTAMLYRRFFQHQEVMSAGPVLGQGAKHPLPSSESHVAISANERVILSSPDEAYDL